MRTSGPVSGLGRPVAPPEDVITVIIVQPVRALGVRLHKEKNRQWTTVEWAVVQGDDPRTMVAHGQIVAPHTYSEPAALRHIYEGILAAVREHGVTRALVWSVEGNAQISSAGRPRLRAEGVACAALALACTSVELVAWKEVEARSGAVRSKGEYVAASEVCGVVLGDADALAVLVAVAALGG